jgi:hypothetical protein
VERRGKECGLHQDSIVYEEGRNGECVRFEKADPTRRLSKGGNDLAPIRLKVTQYYERQHYVISLYST